VRFWLSTGDSDSGLFPYLVLGSWTCFGEDPGKYSFHKIERERTVPSEKVPLIASTRRTAVMVHEERVCLSERTVAGLQSAEALGRVGVAYVRSMIHLRWQLEVLRRSWCSGSGEGFHRMRDGRQ